MWKTMIYGMWLRDDCTKALQKMKKRWLHWSTVKGWMTWTSPVFRIQFCMPSNPVLNFKMPNLAAFGPKILIFTRVNKSFGTHIKEKPHRHLVCIVSCSVMGPNGPKCKCNWVFQTFLSLHIFVFSYFHLSVFSSFCLFVFLSSCLSIILGHLRPP